MDLYRSKEVARDFCPNTNKAHIGKYYKSILAHLAQERMLAKLRFNNFPPLLLYSNRVIEGSISGLHLIAYDKLSDQISVRVPTALLDLQSSTQQPSFGLKILTNPYVRTRAPRITNLSHKRIHISRKIRNHTKVGQHPILNMNMDDGPFEFCTIKKMRAKLGSIKMMSVNMGGYPLFPMI